MACNSKQLIDYENYSNSEILEHYSNSLNAVKSFQASAQITLTYEDNGKIKSDDIRAEIILNQNDSLHIQLNYSILNIDVSTIFIGAEHFVFKTRTEEDDVFIRGYITDNYLNHIFSIDIPLKNWAKTLFLGQVKIPEQNEIKRDSAAVISFISEGQKVTLREDALLPKVAHFYDRKNEEVALLKTYGLIEKNGFEFPKKIVYYNKAANAEMTIDYSEIKINKKLADSDFTVKIPPNVRQVRYE